METIGKPATLNPRFGLMCSGELPGFHRRGLNDYLYYFFLGGVLIIYYSGPPNLIF